MVQSLVAGTAYHIEIMYGENTGVARFLFEWKFDTGDWTSDLSGGQFQPTDTSTRAFYATNHFSYTIHEHASSSKTLRSTGVRINDTLMTEDIEESDLDQATSYVFDRFYQIKSLLPTLTIDQSSLRYTSGHFGDKVFIGPARPSSGVSGQNHNWESAIGAYNDHGDSWGYAGSISTTYYNASGHSSEVSGEWVQIRLGKSIVLGGIRMWVPDYLGFGRTHTVLIVGSNDNGVTWYDCGRFVTEYSQTQYAYVGIGDAQNAHKSRCTPILTADANPHAGTAFRTFRVIATRLQDYPANTYSGTLNQKTQIGFMEIFEGFLHLPLETIYSDQRSSLNTRGLAMSSSNNLMFAVSEPHHNAHAVDGSTQVHDWSATRTEEANITTTFTIDTPVSLNLSNQLRAMSIIGVNLSTATISSTPATVLQVTDTLFMAHIIEDAGSLAPTLHMVLLRTNHEDGTVTHIESRKNTDFLLTTSVDGDKSYDEPAYIRQAYDTGSSATVTVQYVNVRGSLDAYSPARSMNKVGGALALLADRVVIGEPHRGTACAKIVYASS